MEHMDCRSLVDTDGRKLHSTPINLMSTLRILLLTIILPVQVRACLWVDGTTLQGSHRRTEGHFPSSELRRAMAKSPEERIANFFALLRDDKAGDFTQNELEGIQEVLSGNYDQAIDIFTQAETGHPGRYSTAANLGTAYELKGELELALKWIREGIRRNPESHMGTEWLHVEILKTRMKLKDDPGYLRQNHVIVLPDSYSAKTSILIGDGSRTVDEVSESIFYQLEERMIFVKPPDPVVADLLFTFGEIEGRTNVVESGIKLFELANEYGFSNPGLLAGEIGRYKKAIRFGKIKRTGYIVLAVLALILFLIFAWRKKWFFISRKAYLDHQVNKRLHPDGL